ncbi:hypothetical protein RBB50_001902 [Rhinocladiella similis]
MNHNAVEFLPGAWEHIQSRASALNPDARTFVPRVHSIPHIVNGIHPTAPSVDVQHQVAQPHSPESGLTESDPQTPPQTQETARANRPESTFERRLAWIVDCSDGFDYTSTVPTGMSPTNEPRPFRKNGMEYWTKSKDWVHHVNFFGEVVYTKSATNPATTIAVLKASSKWIAKHDPFKSRNHFVVTKASRLLDPVMYHGNPDLLNNLHGTALENACIGQCVKFYTQVGTWMEDDYDEDEHEPYIDSLDPAKYREGQIIINGCTPGFPSLTDILTAGTEEQLAIDKARQAAVKSRVARGTVRSRLSECCVSFNDEDEYPDAVVCSSVHSRSGPSVSGSLPQTVESVQAVTSHPTAPTEFAINGQLSTAQDMGMSREEFHRRLDAFGPPLSSWADDEDDEEHLTERGVFLQRLAALGDEPLGDWADEVEEEAADRVAGAAESSSTEVTDSMPKLGTSSQSVTESAEDMATRPRIVFPSNPLETFLEPATEQPGFAVAPIADGRFNVEEGLSHGRRESSESATSTTSGPSSSCSQDATTPPTSVAGSEEDLDDDWEVNVYESNAVRRHDTAGIAPERSDEEIFGEMTVEQEYELIHGSPMPASQIIANSRTPTTATLVRKCIVKLLFQGPCRPPTMVTVVDVRTLRSGVVMCAFLHTTLLGPLANVQLGYEEAVTTAVRLPLVLYTVPTILTVPSIYSSPVGDLLDQRIVEVVDDEEETTGTVVRPDNGNALESGRKSPSTLQLVPSISGQPTASVVGVPQPCTRRVRQRRNQRVRFALPERPCMSMVSTASPSTSLASLRRSVVVTTVTPDYSPCQSSYDPWADFSGIHYWSPQSSVSRRARARECDDDNVLAPIPPLPRFQSVRGNRRRSGLGLLRSLVSGDTGTRGGAMKGAVSKTKSWAMSGWKKAKGVFTRDQ